MKEPWNISQERVVECLQRLVVSADRDYLRGGGFSSTVLFEAYCRYQVACNFRGGQGPICPISEGGQGTLIRKFSNHQQVPTKLATNWFAPTDAKALSKM
jgi:hypothetical protein